MAGIENRHVVPLRHRVDRREQLEKVAVGIDILLPMRGEQNVLSLRQFQPLMNVACLDLVQICAQHLRHGTAGHKYALLRQAALHQIPPRML